MIRSRAGRIKTSTALVLAAVSLAVPALLAPVLLPRMSEHKELTARVRRADFASVVLASGRVESTSNTEIRCTLERLSSGTTPTILSLVDDGTTVKKDTILAELDSADYREMVRQQTINLQQVRAAYRQAELDLEVAKIGLDAYREGEKKETDRLFRSQLSMAESDLNRQADRLKWTKRMVQKGYASTLQIATDESTMLRTSLSLEQTSTSYRNYLRFTAPKTSRALESQVNGARAALDFQTVRLKREEERLALYQKQVDNCTVRAEHDGFVVYANEQGKPASIFEGAPVRQRQRLFTLPDLSKMEVQALLHETVVNRVKVGMPVSARLEALPGLKVEGVVSAVSPLPLNARKSEQGSDVTYFLGRVQITKVPEGLRPGMSTEIEITTARREGVLAVPQTAVTIDGEQHVCTVVSGENGEHHERRTITIGESSHDLVEVVEGLSPGEIVVLDNEAPDPTLPIPTAEPTGPLAANQARTY